VAVQDETPWIRDLWEQPVRNELFLWKLRRKRWSWGVAYNMATHIISETHRNALSIIFSSFPEDFLVSSYSSSFYLLQIFVNIDEGQQNLGI